jgi:hypothetical protein
MCDKAFVVDPRSLLVTVELFATKYGSGRKKKSTTTAANPNVRAEIKYGPTNRGSEKYSARFPDGSIKFGPATAPMVEPHTTKESCRARLSSEAKSIAAKRAWYPAAEAAPTKKVPVSIKKIFRSKPPAIASAEPISPEIYPTDNAKRLPPVEVNFASGSARAAAPSTALVWANPAKVSDSVIDETKSEPAATVPATPTPFNTCAVAKVLTTLFCSAVFGISEIPSTDFSRLSFDVAL